MKETFISLLNNIDEDIALFNGDSLLDAGIIDSFTIVEIVSEMEKTFHVEISSDDVIEKNFRTVDSMFKLLETIVKRKR